MIVIIWLVLVAKDAEVSFTAQWNVRKTVGLITKQFATGLANWIQNINFKFQVLNTTWNGLLIKYKQQKCFFNHLHTWQGSTNFGSKNINLLHKNRYYHLLTEIECFWLTMKSSCPLQSTPQNSRLWFWRYASFVLSLYFFFTDYIYAQLECMNRV